MSGHTILITSSRYLMLRHWTWQRWQLHLVSEFHQPSISVSFICCQNLSPLHGKEFYCFIVCNITMGNLEQGSSTGDFESWMKGLWRWSVSVGLCEGNLEGGLPLWGP